MERLGRETTTRLVALPESGMGFQYVRASRVEGRTVAEGERRSDEYLVLNAELLVPRRERGQVEKALDAVMLESSEARRAYARLVESAGPAVELRDIQLLPKSAFPAILTRSEAASVQAGKASRGPASAAATGSTGMKERFVRFSAYANDKRVTSGGGLAAGTYVTTWLDAQNVYTGRDAVSRYALPNPQPATNRFEVVPPKPTPVQRGYAQPANGQPGGGEEAIILNLQPAGTVVGPTQIPP